jgi:hypothetical protein
MALLDRGMTVERIAGFHNDFTTWRDSFAGQPATPAKAAGDMWLKVFESRPDAKAIVAVRPASASQATPNTETSPSG